MNPIDPKNLPTAASDGQLPDGDTPLQGEGDYEAARRHRESVEAFVAAGRVEPAARAAAPDSAQEAQDLQQAEAEGRAHAKD